MMMHGPANVKKQVSSVGLGVAAHSLSLMQKRGLFNKIIYIYVYIYIYMYIYIYIYIYIQKRLDVVTAVLLKIQAFWNVTSYIS